MSLETCQVSAIGSACPLTIGSSQERSLSLVVSYVPFERMNTAYWFTGTEAIRTPIQPSELKPAHEKCGKVITDCPEMTWTFKTTTKYLNCKSQFKEVHIAHYYSKLFFFETWSQNYTASP